MIATISNMSLALSLALIAVLGYLGGRRRGRVIRETASARRALERAREVVREMEQISTSVREHLSAYRANLLQFRQRVTELSSGKHEDIWDSLSHDADRLLKPTLQLSSQIGHAYDAIRQQINLLMTFTEVRTDPLTNLRNRRALDETLENRFALLERYGDGFSVAVFDIDHFKQINDQQGHLAGDQILQIVATILEDSARDTDLVTRFGGEEFVIVMPQTPLEGACVFAERTRQRIAEASRVTVSAGVAEGQVGDDAKSLLGRADAALYAAKQAGRDRVFKSDQGQTTLVAALPPVEAES